MWQKGGTSLLLVRLVESLKLYLPFVFLQQSLKDMFGGWASVLWTALLWIVTVERLHAIFFEWATTRFKVDALGVHVRTGLLVRKEISLDRREIASLTVSQSATERFFSCSRVTIGVGSESRQEVVLSGLTADAVAALSSLYDARPVPPVEEGKPATATTPPAVDAAAVQPEMYRIRGREHLLVAVTYGQFLLLLPFAFSALTEVQSWGMLSMRASDITQYAEQVPTWLLIAVGLPVLVSVSLAYGLVITWLKYHGFAVRADGQQFVISGGAVSRDTRRISAGHALGVRITANPAMRALGYARLSIVSRDSAGGARFTTVFPVARLDRIEQTIAEHLPRFAGQVQLSLPPTIKKTLLVSPLLVLAAAAIALFFLDDAAGRLLVAPALLALTYVWHRCWAMIAPGDPNTTLRFSRGFLWRSEYRLDLASVHCVTMSQGPVTRALGLSRLSAFLYTGRALRLSSLIPSTPASPLLAALERMWCPPMHAQPPTAAHAPGCIPAVATGGQRGT